MIRLALKSNPEIWNGVVIRDAGMACPQIYARPSHFSVPGQMTRWRFASFPMLAARNTRPAMIRS
jgi:hypothetical protein